MARSFSPATAEQVISAVEAVVVRGAPANPDFVAEFCDTPRARAEAALQLAADLGFLQDGGGTFDIASPLCRFAVTPKLVQRAAVLRVVLESYLPFTTFRERLIGTGDAAIAAHQTKVDLDLGAHREQVKDTLLSLGTYADALAAEAGGRYTAQPGTADNALQVLAFAAADLTAAEFRVREQLGADAAKRVSRDDVVIPLARALIKAAAADSRGAVVEAGNAIESYLTELSARANVGIAGAHGINAQLERFDQVHWLPKKLVFVGKYLGHVRNAADHGIDPEINAAWVVREATGLEYVFHACSFIAATTAKELGGAEI